MPKCLIVYFSQTGTTARVAESIADGLRGEGYDVDLHNLNGQQPPDIGDYDLYGFGSPVYFYRPPFNVSEYLEGLPDFKNMPAFVFLMHGTYRFDAGNMIRRKLAQKGARESGYFVAHGPDLFVGYLREGYVFSPENPTPEDLSRAESFGREVAEYAAGKPYLQPRYESPPSIIYRLERLLTGPWFARNIFSRLFRVNRSACTTCGLCVKICPTGNIVEGRGRRPVWGRNCLLCLTCELNCPEEAITSPIRWRLFRPFLIYNTRLAARDRAIPCQRIEPRFWRQPAEGKHIAAANKNSGKQPADNRAG